VVITALAMLAFGAHAGTATAAQWTIDGSTLGMIGEESIAGEGGPFTIYVPTLALKIVCQTEKGTGTIFAGKEGTGTFELTECAVASFPNCKIEEPLALEADSQLVEVGGNAYAVFTSEEFAQVFILGALCPFFELNEILQGEISAGIKAGEALEKTLTFSGESRAAVGALLLFGEEEATFEGVSTRELSGPNSGETWGACTTVCSEDPPYTPVEGYGSENPGQPGIEYSCTGDPINCATGNLIETQTDIDIGGRGPGLKVTRSYNSQIAAAAGSAGAWGYGWTGPYSARLAIDEKAKTATVHHDNGSGVIFYLAESKYSPAPWTQSTLAKEGETYLYTLPDQTVLSFDKNGKLTAETDRNGNSIALSYDEKGRLKAATDDAERELKFAYTAEDQVKTITDPMGNVVEYTYESGKLDTVTLPDDEEPRWEFGYNASREMTSLTDGRGNTTTNKYDGSNRVTEQVDAMERKRTLEYKALSVGSETKIKEPNGAVTVEQFNDANQLKSVTRASGTALAATTTYGYDNDLNLVEVTDPNENTTEYDYDAEGNRTNEKDANGNETKSTYNKTHDVLTTTTPKGETTTITRDGDGNPEVVKRPAPSEKTQETKFKYASNGDLESETDPLGRTTTYEYDEYGNQESETNAEGDERTWTFNKNSYMTSEVSPRGNEEGAEATKFTTKIEPDELGRPLTITDPLGHTTEYVHNDNGNVESVTDGNGHTTTYTYNKADERTKVELPNETETETGYNSMGEVTSKTNGNGQTTKYERNLLGQVTEEIDPLSRKTVKEYDDAGNLEKLKDAASRTITYTYDPGNRLTKVDYSEASTADVAYVYDKNSNVTEMKDGTGTSKHKYDELGRLIEVENGAKEVIEYEYDLADQQTNITYPNSKTVTRAYDKAGRLEKITDWLEKETKFAYNRDSQLKLTTFPSGTTNKDEYEYNAAGELTKVTMKKEAETLASLTYARDNDGQVESVTQTGLPGAEKVEYKYDENDRLTKAGGTEYKYDAANNPTTIGASTFAYDKASQLEKGTGITSYTFNAVGERTKSTPESGPATTYGYDQAGNLISVKRPEEGAVKKIEDTYAYDGDGLRASQTISGSKVQLAWDVSKGLPKLLNDGANSYIYGPGGLPIAQINGEGKPLYLHQDHQGSTRMLTGATGSNEGAYSYGPYGSIEAQTGTATTPLGYNSQYTNASTGLIYLRARTYDPVTAQFLSVDPAVSGTGAPYTYADDNPLNASDPSGLATRGWCATFAGDLPGAQISVSLCWIWDDAGREGFSFTVGTGVGITYQLGDLFYKLFNKWRSLLNLASVKKLIGGSVIIGRFNSDAANINDLNGDSSTVEYAIGWKAAVSTQSFVGPGGVCGSITGAGISGPKFVWGVEGNAKTWVWQVR
jgi:RHS repeat-associated protein